MLMLCTCEQVGSSIHVLGQQTPAVVSFYGPMLLLMMLLTVHLDKLPARIKATLISVGMKPFYR